jgi:hypothetical protein
MVVLLTIGCSRCGHCVEERCGAMMYSMVGSFSRWQRNDAFHAWPHQA